MSGHFRRLASASGPCQAGAACAQELHATRQPSSSDANLSARLGRPAAQPSPPAADPASHLQPATQAPAFDSLNERQQLQRDDAQVFFDSEQPHWSPELLPHKPADAQPDSHSSPTSCYASPIASVSPDDAATPAPGHDRALKEVQHQETRLPDPGLTPPGPKSTPRMGLATALVHAVHASG